MITLSSEVVQILGKVHPISHWGVWFMTPFGVTDELAVAKQFCLQRDADPDLVIQPIPVAFYGDGHYEIFYPRG